MTTPDRADSDGLDLLAELAIACVGGHTRVVLTRRVAEALGRYGPVRWLELAWGDDDAVEARRQRQEWVVTAGAPTRPAAALLTEASVTHRPVEATAAGRSARTGATLLVALPLFEDGAHVGGVTLGLERPDARWREPRWLHALGAVLLAGHRACRTIERVAAVSLRAHEENRALRRRLEATAGSLVSRSPAMRDALLRADLVAEHDTTVLLRGESGTGKGVLARRIHAGSARASGPFVHVDCASLPEALVESELFGHEPGAFTGATRRHAGRVERAAGGTLFLDEVGELAPATQAKLLRLLQDGTFERVGGERELKARARVIAATHRPLEAMVERGELRADLYHRLAVFPITLPPLRDRGEDLPALVDAALERAAARLSRRARPTIADDALAELGRHAWPGNVRELENVLERAAILARGGPIDARALGDAGLGSRRARAAAPDAAPVQTLEDAVRDALARALRATGGRIYGPDGAAALLGLKPTTLQTKLAAAGLRRADFVR